MPAPDEEELKKIFEEASIPQLDPNDVIAQVMALFTQPYTEDELLMTLTELQNKELVAIARLMPVISALEKGFGITLPVGEFVRLVLLGRISKYRRGRKEFLELISRYTGAFPPSAEARRLFRKWVGEE